MNYDKEAAQAHAEEALRIYRETYDKVREQHPGWSGLLVRKATISLLRTALEVSRAPGAYTEDP